MKLCFATNNKNKLYEIQQLVPASVQLVSLQDIGCTEDIPETEPTIEGNSMLKAAYVFDNYKLACFADDSGLEVDALEGAPGVFSARYAGPACNSEDNINKLLKELKGKENRKAQFKTIITLISENENIQFEGIIRGTISEEKRGEKGFGYDPVFIPEGHSVSFAEMSTEEKNTISHRAIATKKLIKYLNKLI